MEDNAIRGRAPLVCLGQDLTLQASACLGGKGRNLGRLAAFGQPVPPWYGITTAAFRSTLEQAGLRRQIEELVAALAPAADQELIAAARRIQARIDELELPTELVQRIGEAQERCLPGDPALAVRSSAADEDGLGSSFAGLHESVLGVHGLSGVLTAVKRVWASAYSAPALSYRLAKGLPVADIAMAVIVQRMIPATASGVLFTADPATGNVHQIVINALYGLGEGVVDGDLLADRFTVDKKTRETAARIVAKTERMVDAREPMGGLRRDAVPEAERDKSSLSDAQILALARAGQAIEGFLGCPQDIEFAVGPDGEIAILQSRPITTLEEDGPAAGNPILWDNAAWVENLSGVVSPMTFSVTRRTGNLVGRFLYDLLGIDRTLVHEHPNIFELPVGYIRGRLYLNLTARSQMWRFVPGLRFHERWFRSLLGPGEEAEGTSEKPLGWRRRYFVELPALLRLAGRVVFNLLAAPRESGRFQKRTRALYSRCAAMDFDTLKAHELMAFYEEIEQELAQHWRAPQLNGLYARAFYALLSKLCGAWCGDATKSLRNDLLRGEDGVKSVDPIHHQLRLALRVRHDPPLRALFESHSAEELAEIVPADRRYAAFAAEVARYQDLYFFKCPDEMKLEAPSLRDRPAEIYRAISRYATGYSETDLDGDARQASERQARITAEARAFAALRQPLVGPLKRAVFRWVLKNARLGVKNRENIKFLRLQLTGLFRELIQALGRKLAVGGILDKAEDVFNLTLEEVFAFIQGKAVTANLRGLAALHCEELGQVRLLAGTDAPGERFTTYGMVYHRNRFKAQHRATTEPEDGVLRGIGSCKGVVTARVRVLQSPEEDVRAAGEILAVPSAGTGWTFHFPAISGLLIERGEVLSHTATLAREMGIPTIVGIPGLLAVLDSGPRITMDGAAGTVRILEGDSGVKEP